MARHPRLKLINQPRMNELPKEEIESKLFKENPYSEDEEKLNPVIAIVDQLPPMERIMFRNSRDPGVTLDFHYSSKNVPLTAYHLRDGKEVDLPVEVVDHLMDRKVPIYAHRKNADGEVQMYIKSYKYHFHIQRIRKAA